MIKYYELEIVVELWKNHNKLKPAAATILTGIALAGCGVLANASVNGVRPAVAEVEAVAVTPTIHNETPAKQPFDIEPKLHNDLAEALKGYSGEIQVAIRDRNTGQIYQFTNMPNPDQTINTASTVKLSILEAMLLQNQENNEAFVTCPDHPEIPMPIQMTCEQLAHTIPMITESSDDDASALWVQVGGPQTLQDFYHRIGTHHTTADANSQWGWTQSTALDQLRVVDQLNGPTSLLSPSSRAVANFLLGSVIPEQRWGVGGGSVAPTDFVNKNGWMPTSQHRPQWTINSVGNVNDGMGLNYDLVEYSDNNTSDQSGIDNLNAISAIVHRDMAAATISLRPHVGGGR
jgi:hypothetical protein